VLALRLDARSGVPAYLQLVQQVRHAVQYGLLRSGDQLPTVREVVGKLGINPNTVLKAYRELERDGLVHSRRGLGTFVAKTAPRPIASAVHAPLRRALARWLESARRAGLDREAAGALFALALQEAYGEDVA
jgi:GntR family transcriptional regulator